MMTDSIDTTEIGTYRRMFDDRFAEIADLLADLPAEALLWKPFESSPWKGASGQLGWLVAHAISSAVYLLRRAEWTMGRIEWSAIAGDEGKDEFGAANHDPAYLAARAGHVQEFVHRTLDTLTPEDLAASRPHERRPELVFSARFDVQHAFEHMSQHIGHAQITRQLWALKG
jgi:hypothetical protein